MRLAVPLLPILLLLAAACAAPRETTPPAGASVPVQAAASVPPLAWLVDRVGGERVETVVLIPPGASPHAFEPSPRQVAAVVAADLFVVVGDPDFAFEARLVDRLLGERENAEEGRKNAEVVELAAVAASAADDDALDPHLWLVPRHLESAASAIADALSDLDPEGEAVYRANYEALEAELDTLDDELRQHLGGLAGGSFYVEHPAWGHLAAEYGLTQVALEEEGKEPRAGRLVEAIESARRDGVTLVLVQRGVAERAGRTLADEIGAEVVEVDPLAYDVAANLRRVSEVLQRAVGRRAR